MISIFCAVVCLLTAARVFPAAVTHSQVHVTPDPVEPLFLTPYIEAGQYNEAQVLSKVSAIKEFHEESYSGYITVNKTYNSNLFFWFFPAKKNPQDVPVILYLEGGPGDTSLSAIFSQSGPVIFDKDMNLLAAKETWTEKYSVVYVDNPVGTGYSFTDTDDGYATNQDDVARDLYSFLLQFLQMFHQFSSNDLYFAGQSYGGKYLPAIGYKVHVENMHAQQKINMKGLFVISGFSDPISIFPHYAELLFYVGMLSEKERDVFQNLSDKVVELIKQKKYLEAVQVNEELFFGSGKDSVFSSKFYNCTGSSYTWNFLETEDPVLLGKIGEYLNQTDIRHAIHVGSKPFVIGPVVFQHLQEDLFKSVKPWVTILMDNYKVMYVSGQQDIIVNTAGTESFLMSVPWKGLDRYKTVDKVIWKVNPNDTEPAGYVRQVDSFYQVIVRNAGHAVALDQRERCYDLLQRFIEGRTFTS